MEGKVIFINLLKNIKNSAFSGTSFINYSHAQYCNGLRILCGNQFKIESAIFRNLINIASSMLSRLLFRIDWNLYLPKRRLQQ